LKRGTIEGSNKALKQGQTFHRFLLTISSDFYTPRQIASLHQGIYRDRHFNSDGSANNVQKVITRLRKWFKQNRLPLDIIEKEGGYTLHASAPMKLLVPLPVRQHDTRMWWVEKARDKIDLSNFMAKELVPLLGISYRSVMLLIKDATDRGECVKSGEGHSTK